MPKDNSVSMSHNQIGSDRNRRLKSLPVKENIEKAQPMLAEAKDIFAKLDGKVAEAQIKDLEESGPRLANFQDLVFLGKMEKTIEIAGWIFQMHTLTAKEQRDLLSHIMSLPADKRLIFAKPYTIWMSLDTINDTPIEVAASSAGYEDDFDFICSWQDPLIERLFSEYEKLFNSSKSVFQADTVENDLKK